MNFNEVEDKSYTISAYTKEIEITDAGEQKDIELYVYKKSDIAAIPYENAKVKVDFIDKVVGGFDANEKSADANGKVTFTYTAPNDIKNLDDLKVRFYLENNESVESNITIKFKYKSISANTKLEVSPNNITVTSPNEENNIKVLVLDEDDKPIEGVKISISGKLVEDGVDYGSIDKSEITTDSTGVATFKYTSPDSVEELYEKEKNLTLRLENSDIEKNITIKYINPQTISSVKKIVLDPSEFTVAEGVEQTISVYTFDENNSAVSGTLYVDSLIDENNKIFGEITPSIIKTDSSGKATIKYTPVSNIYDFSGESKKVRIRSANNKEVNLTINFPAKKEIGKLILSPDFISVVKGLTKEIKILTLTNDNKPISTTVELPSLIDSDNKTLLGTFSEYSVKTDEKGEATVTYTAPSDVSNITGEKKFTINVKDSSISADLTLDFSNTQAVEKVYKINLTAPDYVEITGKANIVIDIVERDNEDKYIDSNNIHKVTVETQNGLLYFDESFSNTSYEYNTSSRKSIYLYSKYNTGIEIIKVTADIFNGENNVTISDTFALTVSSGPVSAISLVYKNTEYNAPFFEDVFTLHAVDKYGNPAKKGTKIEVGVVSGVRVGGNGNYLKVDKNGSLGKNNVNEIEFNLTNSDYNLTTVHDKYNNDEGSDSLIILANEDRFSPLYLGGWIVEEVIDNDTLILNGDFNLTNTKMDLLSFVIGNEKRYNECESTYNVIDFDQESKTYLLDENGNAKLILRYDPFFIGHDVFIYANSVSENKRVGVSLRKKLWGSGLDTTTFECDGTSADANCTKYITFSIKSYGGSLKKVKFSENNFKAVPYKDIGDGTGNLYPCNNYTLSVLSEDSGCGGQVQIKIEVPSGNACKVMWNGSLNYEY